MKDRGSLRPFAVRRPRSTKRRPALEGLESRQLLALSIAEFPTQLVGGLPTSITPGPDGDLWFTLPQFNAIGSFNPTTHAFQAFVNPTLGALPEAIAAGPDGNLWFTTARNLIGTFNPTTDAFTETTVPSGNQTRSITVGPDGNLWFTEMSDLGSPFLVGEINPETRAVLEFNVPNATSIEGITSGPDGDLWFTDFGGKVDSINPTTHAIAEYTVPFQSYTIDYQSAFTTTTIPGLTGITEGPDGALWYTESQANRIGSFNPATGAFSTFFLPTPNSSPQGIVAGPDGQVWFTETGILTNFPTGGLPSVPTGRSAIGSIDPTTGAIATYDTPSINTDPTSITVGPGGQLWFTEALADQIGEGIIHPADGPQVLSVARLGIHAQATSLVLTFTEPLDPTSAQNLANYTLVGPNRRPVRIASAVYDATVDTVTLSPAARLNVHWNYTLTVNGTPPLGVTDIYGDLLDGAGTGQPGSDYVATITRANLVLARSVPTVSRFTLRAEMLALRQAAAAARRHRA